MYVCTGVAVLVFLSVYSVLLLMVLLSASSSSGGITKDGKGVTILWYILDVSSV